MLHFVLAWEKMKGRICTGVDALLISSAVLTLLTLTTYIHAIVAFFVKQHSVSHPLHCNVGNFFLLLLLFIIFNL